MADSLSILFDDIESGNVSSVESRIKSRGIDSNSLFNSMTPLYLASKRGRTDIVKLLLSHNSDIDRGFIEADISPIEIACIKGHFDVVQLLLSSGANINRNSKKSFSSIYHASQNGHVKIVQLLLSHGADPNVGQASSGLYPLFAACLNQHEDIAHILLENNADPNIGVILHDGATPLFMASQVGNINIVSDLIQHNANVDQATSKNRFTPLIVASEMGHLDIVKLLIKSGANPFHVDNNGNTARYPASLQGHTEIEEYLQTAIMRSPIGGRTPKSSSNSS